MSPAFIIIGMVFLLVFFLLNYGKKQQENSDGEGEPIDVTPLRQVRKQQLKQDNMSAVKEQVFALALGNPEQYLCKMGDKISSYTGTLMMSNYPDRKRDILDYMEKVWRISFDEHQRDRVIYCLKRTWSEGSVSQLVENYSLMDEVSIKAMVAVDVAQFVHLTRLAYMINLLDDDECWGMLFLNAQRAQDCFDNWDDFIDHYVEGKSFLNEMINYDYSGGDDEDDDDKNDDDKGIEDIREEMESEFDKVKKDLCSSAWLNESVFTHFTVDVESNKSIQPGTMEC